MKPTDMDAGLDLQVLRSLLDYNASTGIFRWKHRRLAGKVAGCTTSNNGYIAIYVCGRLYLAHRLAWFYVNGEWPSRYLDHQNGVKTDNRFCNIRLCSQRQNMANQNKLRKNNKTGFRGVSFRPDSGKYRAVMKIGCKQISLGSFKTALEAKTAYDEMHRTVYGKFAGSV